MAKSFEQSGAGGAVDAHFPRRACRPPPHSALTVNGAVKQDADTAQMIWSVPEIIAHLSPPGRAGGGGTLSSTGTPEGGGGRWGGATGSWAEIEGLEPLAVAICVTGSPGLNYPASQGCPLRQAEIAIPRIP